MVDKHCQALWVGKRKEYYVECNNGSKQRIANQEVQQTNLPTAIVNHRLHYDIHYI